VFLPSSFPSLPSFPSFLTSCRDLWFQHF
jgi:hypothetical protein